MNFRNLEYFRAIAEENSISKAAERLHVSQQSLSEMLKKMENEIETPLVRRGHPMTLTPAGEVFFAAAKDILDRYRMMQDEIAAISEKDRVKLTLAVPSTETPPFLPGLLTEFTAAHPEYEVKIIRCNPIEAAKCARRFDLYFSTLPLGEELEHIHILEGGTYAVVLSPSLANRVYGERWSQVEREILGNKDIRTLREMPFIALCNQANEMVLDLQIIFQKAGFEPNIAFQSGDSELNLNMCVLGTGAYVAKMDYCERRFSESIVGRDDIRLYPIDTEIDPVVIALSYRRGMRLTKADRCFISAAKKYLQDHHIQGMKG
ncbi:MAG: LysR family transcriptional regulator [Lachnospiraceae bacterium]|nr:LysR family transcriptional regulator [Lachnospiraceae bacterium]